MRIGRIGAWAGAAFGMMGMAGAAPAMDVTDPGALDVFTVNAGCTPATLSFAKNPTLVPTDEDTNTGEDNIAFAVYDGAGALLRYKPAKALGIEVFYEFFTVSLDNAVGTATMLPFEVRIIDVTGAVNVASIKAGTVLHAVPVAERLMTGQTASCNALPRRSSTRIAPTQGAAPA